MVCKFTGTWLQHWSSTTTTATSARRTSFILIFQGNCEIRVIKVRLPSLGQHNRLIVKLKSTLDCNWSGRLTFLTFPLCRTFGTITCAGDLRSGHGLEQILHRPDFDNFGDPYTLLTRGLSNNRRLDSSYTKASFRGVPSIFSANHNNIIRLLQIIQYNTISFRQFANPWVVNRVFAVNTCNFYSTQQHRNPFACKEFLLSEQTVPCLTLHATDSRVNGTMINGDMVKVQLKSGHFLCRATLKQCCQLQDLKLITMFFLLITAKKSTWRHTKSTRYRCRRLRNPPL